jgi:hypothetical protein
MTRNFVARAILMLGLLITVVLLPIEVFAQNDAMAAINSARQQLIICYSSARQAEAAGANITSLTSVLNGAGALLSQSELAYSQGDFTSAQSLSSQVEEQLANFVSTANAMRETAARQQSFDFWVIIVGSIGGAVAVIVAGLAGWLVLKKRYMINQVEIEAGADEPSGD